MENLSSIYQDIGPYLLAGDHLTQEEAAKEALAMRINQKFALLEEVRPVIETMTYHDKYKKILDEIWKDKVELDGKIVKEEEEAAKAMGILTNVLCQVGVTTIISKFIILDIPIDRDAPIVVGRGSLYTIAARFDVLRTSESDSNDEDEYQIKRNKFGAPIYGSKPAPYLNCNDPADQSLALHAVIKPFRKISVWKKAVSFLGSLPVPLKQVNLKPDYKACYTKETDARRDYENQRFMISVIIENYYFTFPFYLSL
nr:hypothetical protein [Tanacetum cinerariifolium]